MKRLTLSLLALALVACGGTRKGNQNNDGGNSDGGNNVNVIVNLTGTGTVQKDGATVCDGSVVSCAVPVEKGASVTLVAVPGEGFDFTSWNCGTANTSPSQMIATTTGVTCALTFTKKKVGYTAVVTPTSGGTIIGTPGNVTCGVGGSMCAATGIDYGTSVNLNLVKAQGYAFIGWTGATECAGVNTSLTFPLKSDITCTATLMKGAISISGSMSGAPGTISYAQGSGTVHSTCTSSGCGADPDGSGASTQATLTAPFVDGYYFTGWTGAGCTGGANYSTEVKGATTDVVCVANYVALTSTFNGLWANPAGACKSPETKLTFSLPAGAQAFCRLGPTGGAAVKANDDVDKMSYSDCSSGIVLAASAKYVSGYYRLDVQLRASGVTRAETTFSYPFYYHPSLACAQTCPDLTVSDDAFFAAALASDGYYDRFKDSKRSLNATPTTLMFNTVSTKTPFIRFELQDPAHDPVSGLGNIVGAHLVKRNSLRRRFATYTAPGAAKPSLLLFARHIESSKQRAAANIQYCDNGFQFGISEVNDKLMTWTIPGAPHYEARSYDCDAIVINPKGEGSCFVIESGKPVRKISSVSMWYKVETDGGSNTGYHRHQHWSSSFLTLLDSPD